MLALLGGLAVTAQAQVVIGSWQGSSAEGWTDQSSVSITAPANMPSRYEFMSGVAAGYAQSLSIHEDGYGNDRLMINLTSIAGGLAAWTNNNFLNFTMSCAPGTAGGYQQLVAVQYNSDVSGWHQITGGWTAAGFSETGDTGADSGGQPIYYFWSGSAARSQVVTWNYSSIKASIGNSPAYLQITLVFQTDGTQTNIFMNNVNLSGAEVPTIWVDQFNPTNAYATGANDYDIGQNITNVYNLWTGYGGNTAVDPTNITWDATQDGNTNASSGSLKIVANFGGDYGVNQMVLWDRGPNNTFSLNPPITNGLSLLTFEYDIKYDPSSPTAVSGTITNYGFYEWGVVPSYAVNDLETFRYNVTNTSWVHRVVTLNPGTDSDLLNITGMFFKQYSGYDTGLNGQTTLWLDNLKFTYTNVAPVPPLPILDILTPMPAMRIFAGDSGNIYSREMLATSDSDKSWIGGAYPAKYSFTILNYPSPANINQTHIFLLPLNAMLTPDTYKYVNAVDYSYASNAVWLSVGPGPSGGTALVSVLWKTNKPSANPDHTALTFTNVGVVGTWTLEFDTDSTGKVIGPGPSTNAFTIADPNIDADFGNPLIAYFGLQPNGTAGEGQYEDWASISITGVNGASLTEDFTTEPTRNPSGNWTEIEIANSIVVITPSDVPSYWVNWTLPAANFDIGAKTNLLTQSQWISPAYYSGYSDNAAPYGAATQYGAKMWVLLPPDDQPTANGVPGGARVPDAFFVASTNVTYPPWSP